MALRQIPKVPASFKFIQTDEYMTDTLLYWAAREQEIVYKSLSPSIGKRRFIVDWVTSTAERFRMGRGTAHLGVRILDLYMDGHAITDSHLILVGLIGLNLAAKIEERENHVPRFRLLLEHTMKLGLHGLNGVDKKYLAHLEVMILLYFDWKICLPTVYKYVEMLLPVAASELLIPTAQAALNGGDPQESANLFGNFVGFVNYFCDISLQNAKFVAQPSQLKVAAAVLFCARLSFGLSPPWTDQLHEATGGIMEDDIIFLNSELIRVYHEGIRREQLLESEALAAAAHSQQQQPGQPLQTSTPTDVSCAATRSANEEESASSAARKRRLVVCQQNGDSTPTVYKVLSGSCSSESMEDEGYITITTSQSQGEETVDSVDLAVAAAEGRKRKTDQVFLF